MLRDTFGNKNTYSLTLDIQEEPEDSSGDFDPSEKYHITQEQVKFDDFGDLELPRMTAQLSKLNSRGQISVTFSDSLYF